MTNLHPLLATLLAAHPDVFEVDTDGSLLVLDRQAFATIGAQLAPAAPMRATGKKVAARKTTTATKKTAARKTAAKKAAPQKRAPAVAAAPPAPPAPQPAPVVASTLPPVTIRPQPVPPPAALRPVPPPPPRCRTCRELDVVDAWGKECDECAQTPAVRTLPQPAAPARVEFANGQSFTEAELDESAAEAERPRVIPEPAAAAREDDDAGDLIIVGGPRAGLPPVTMPDDGLAIVEACRDGLPEVVPLLIHPNVRALFGFDMDLSVDCVRHPMGVELDTTFKQRSFPVVRFRRGDLYVVVSFRDRQRPAMLGVYVDAALEHDTHRVNAVGGGGSRKRPGKPGTPTQLATRLRELGVTVGEPNAQGRAQLTYAGQDLGIVQVDGIARRDTVISDWDRAQRRVEAINRRREAVGAG